MVDELVTTPSRRVERLRVRVLDAVARRGHRARDHAAAGVPRPRRVVRRRPTTSAPASGARSASTAIESVEPHRRARRADRRRRRRRRVGGVVRRRRAAAGHAAAAAGGAVGGRALPGRRRRRASTAGCVEARFPVASERWLERLLLRARARTPRCVEPAGVARPRAAARGAAACSLQRLRRVERVEVGVVDDAVGGEEVGEHGGGGAWRRRGRRGGRSSGDVVAGAQRRRGRGSAGGRGRAGGTARSVHSRRSSASGTPCAAGRLLDELGVEVGVVGGEHGAVEPRGAARRARRRPAGRVRRRPAGDAVDVARTDPAPRPGAAGRGSTTVDDGAVGLDGDEADLQDAVARGSTARTSPRRRRRTAAVPRRRPYDGGVSASSWRPSRDAPMRAANSAARPESTAARRRGWRRRCARRRSA